MVKLKRVKSHSPKFFLSFYFLVFKFTNCLEHRFIHEVRILKSEIRSSTSAESQRIEKWNIFNFFFVLKDEALNQLRAVYFWFLISDFWLQPEGRGNAKNYFFGYWAKEISFRRNIRTDDSSHIRLTKVESHEA